MYYCTQLCRTWFLQLEERCACACACMRVSDSDSFSVLAAGRRRCCTAWRGYAGRAPEAPPPGCRLPRSGSRRGRGICGWPPGGCGRGRGRSRTAGCSGSPRRSARRETPPVAGDSGAGDYGMDTPPVALRGTGSQPPRRSVWWIIFLQCMTLTTII